MPISSGSWTFGSQKNDDFWVRDLLLENDDFLGLAIRIIYICPFPVLLKSKHYVCCILVPQSHCDHCKSIPTTSEASNLHFTFGTLPSSTLYIWVFFKIGVYAPVHHWFPQQKWQVHRMILGCPPSQQLIVTHPCLTEKMVSQNPMVHHHHNHNHQHQHHHHTI